MIVGWIGWGSPMYSIPPDPYNAANAYAMSGALTDPAISGLCVDTNMQCSIWASTGIAPGSGAGLGYGVGMGLGYGELGLNPLMGRSIYEQGLLRSPTKSTIYPKSAIRNKLLPSNTYSPKTD
ncbi:hypothetical protein KIN20_014482 [Parelaphostrongylus tenuis]|uniref:Uncharacterized protein n=1 Tax=Parelaphostrongylus tenuis TaxID=148309 RepID=A0AAD5MZM3_PARTN|nr:hypothetical protein KIN20_014482 [Parelaphostrongylus tenuis]